MFAKMTFKCSCRSCSVKFTPLIRRNCFATVLLPESPAPRMSIFTSFFWPRFSLRSWLSMSLLASVEGATEEPQAPMASPAVAAVCQEECGCGSGSGSGWVRAPPAGVSTTLPHRRGGGRGSDGQQCTGNHVRQTHIDRGCLRLVCVCVCGSVEAGRRNGQQSWPPQRCVRSDQSREREGGRERRDRRERGQAERLCVCPGQAERQGGTFFFFWKSTQGRAPAAALGCEDQTPEKGRDVAGGEEVGGGAEREGVCV
mmetsp:Transcript_5559/g.14066  ORF Transcript_5559/g.14066 Transcript_5559/m.14066 type:complete len:256 (+) Transcript_5559:1061-1828(+)